MNSLVLGATGIVGGLIIDQLVLAGSSPLALSRAPPADARGAKWFVADLAAPLDLNLPPFDTLFCTAHSHLLANALPRLRHPNLRRVVLFTSTSIVTKINSDIASERDGLRRLADGEQASVSFCKQWGIEWTVLRPTMIYKEGSDANVSRLAALIRRFGVMPLAGRGAGLRQPVHAQDLAIGALQAARSPAAANKIYVLPGGDTISYREMAGRIFDGLGKPRRLVPVPPVLWHAAFTFAKPFLPHANAAMGDRMSQDMIFDPKPAIEDFGWRPRGFRPNFKRT